MATPRIHPSPADTRSEPFIGSAPFVNIIHLFGTLSLDILLVALGLILAWGVRASIARFYPIPTFWWTTPAVIDYAICGVITIALFLYDGIYDTNIPSLDQTHHLVKSLTGALIAQISYSFIAHDHLLSRLLISLWYIGNLFLFTLIRPIMRKRLASVINKEVILIPSDEKAAVLARGLKASTYRLRVETPQSASCRGLDGLGKPNHGGMAGIMSIAGTQIDLELLAKWEEAFGVVGLLPIESDLTILGATAVNLQGLQIFVINHPLRRRMNSFIKRAFDVAISGTLLVALAPLFLALSVAVMLDSPGPVLFGHARLGKGGKTFRVWKFRTMQIDAEQRLNELLESDPRLKEEFNRTFKLKNDPRVTNIGRILRRSSLDELPQLWNVLIGDMSLVGPRPIVSAEKVYYGHAYPLVSTVRPGITGMWQTSGRNDIAYETRKFYDAYYVRQWSLWLDLALLLKTIQALLLPDGY